MEDVINQQKVVEAVHHFMNRVSDKSPEVADRLSQKWAEDQEAFFHAARTAGEGKPTSTWSKANCKSCYGRGFTGKMVGTGLEVKCKCAIKGYQLWLREFRKEYLENVKRDKYEHENAADSTPES